MDFREGLKHLRCHECVGDDSTATIFLRQKRFGSVANNLLSIVLWSRDVM